MSIAILRCPGQDSLFTSDVKSLEVYRQETNFAVAVLLRNDNFVQGFAPTRSENYPVSPILF